jgi:hypothetical protein
LTHLRLLESGGARIACLSAQDLIFLKSCSWREKDKLDFLALQEVLSGPMARLAQRDALSGRTWRRT